MKPHGHDAGLRVEQAWDRGRSQAIGIGWSDGCDGLLRFPAYGDDPACQLASALLQALERMIRSDLMELNHGTE